MKEKNPPNFSSYQPDIIKILEFLGSVGICINLPNFYNSLAFIQKIYFIWGCTVIVFTFVTINFNNRLKKTENFCETFDDKEDIMDILKQMLMIQTIQVFDEMNKKRK